MRRLLVTGIGGVIALTLILVSPLMALEVPPAPPLERPVVDKTGTLGEAGVNAVVTKINEGRAQKDYQIGVLIIPTLGNDEYLEGYSLEVARQWGIGAAEKDNGVLLIVVKDDRKARIEVGRGLEGDLTDAESSRIIRNTIAPEFRGGNYIAGVVKAVESIQSEVEGRSDPHGQTSGNDEDFDWASLLFFGAFIIIPWLASVLGRSKSWWAGGIVGGGVGTIGAFILGWTILTAAGVAVLATIGLLFDYFVSRNYRSHIARGDNVSWWAGGGHWGSGSGGGGFGGGGFGGGGASGDW